MVVVSRILTPSISGASIRSQIGSTETDKKCKYTRGTVERSFVLQTKIATIPPAAFRAALGAMRHNDGNRSLSMSGVETSVFRFLTSMALRTPVSISAAETHDVVTLHLLEVATGRTKRADA